MSTDLVGLFNMVLEKIFSPTTCIFDLLLIRHLSDNLLLTQWFNQVMVETTRLHNFTSNIQQNLEVV